VPDCAPHPDWQLSSSRLERIARALGAEPDELRWWLREEVDRRSRERAARHELAHARLDLKIGLASRR
jgi:hypothetical protein